MNNNDVVIDMHMHIDCEIFSKAVNGDEEAQKYILKGVAAKAIEFVILEFAQTKVWLDMDKAKKI